MWSAPNKPVPRYQIEQEALNVLVRAIDDCIDFDVGERSEGQEALSILTDRHNTNYGVRDFRKATKEADPIKSRNDMRLSIQKIISEKSNLNIHNI